MQAFAADPAAPPGDVFHRRGDVPESRGEGVRPDHLSRADALLPDRVRRDPGDPDPSYFLDVSNSAFGQMEISFIVISSSLN
jgi:hypothetical protein